jgi:hypothetical protein
VQGSGFFYEPTVLSGIEPGMAAFDGEISGVLYESGPTQERGQGSMETSRELLLRFFAFSISLMTPFRRYGRFTQHLCSLRCGDHSR